MEEAENFEAESPRSESNPSVKDDDSNNEGDLEQVPSEDEEEIVVPTIPKASKKTKKKNKKALSVAVAEVSEDEKPAEKVVSEDEVEVSSSANKSKRRRNKNKETKVLNKSNEVGNNLEDLDEKSSKNAARNERKMKGKDFQQDSTSSKSSTSTSASLKCVVCAATFPSKNKLFDHLKATKHAIYIEKPSVESEEGHKKKGKKK